MSNNIPENFCIAPWVHAMHDTNNLRKLCCISLCDIPKDFKTLDDFRNSDEIKNVRKQMMSGVLPHECRNCDGTSSKQTFVNLYKNYFNNLYGQHYDDVLSKTSEDGHTTADIRTFDYRFGNTCNYKCRHCNSSNSSLIQYEEEKYDIVSGEPIVVNNVDLNLRYQNLEKEILHSAHNGTLEELQWAGGESLFSEAHWRIMSDIAENGNPSDIRVSYITNLSIVEFKGIDFLDLLNNFKGVSIHASIESGGLAAEYIRDGLDWNTWKTNFKKFNDKYKNKPDFYIGGGLTLTSFSLPGLRDFFEYMSREDGTFGSVNLHNNSNPNNQHLDVNSLGKYKAQWMKEYWLLVEEYKNKLQKYNYDSLVSAGNILEKQEALDLDDYKIRRLQRSIKWANDVDSIRNGIKAVDVIKDYPFMLEWWEKVNSAL